MPHSPHETLLTTDDTLHMLDTFLEKWDREWWDGFYADQGKAIPFFVHVPDENLVSFVERAGSVKGVALDIGCGNGRNSVYLAREGYGVTGIDLSDVSIAWAKENAAREGVRVDFSRQSFFDFEGAGDGYDLIHDSGCLHHIKPHRRGQYLEKVRDLLKEDGYFSLTCFNLKGGANLSDHDVYRKESMEGGLGFSEEKMKQVLKPYFDLVAFREMKESSDERVYGKAICWAVLMQKKEK